MKVGDTLKLYRENLGLTQTEMGKRVGVTQGMVGFWEREEREMPADRAIDLEEEYHIPAETICTTLSRYEEVKARRRKGRSKTSAASRRSHRHPGQDAREPATTRP